MATKTSLLGLTKPAYTEAADIAVLNTNFDLIDKAVGNGRYVRQELDNSWFVDPINQRGHTGTYEGVENYTTFVLDRWKTWSTGCSYTIASTGLQITNKNTSSTAGPWEVLPNPERMKGKAYTLAVGYGGGNVVCGSVTVPSGSVTADNYVTAVNAAGAIPGLRLVIYAKDQRVEFQIMVVAGQTITVEWAALYEGAYTAETLPAYVYKGYAAELAECQRYYRQSYTGDCSAYGCLSFIAPTIGQSVPAVHWDMGMRTAPTVTIKSWGDVKENAVRDWAASKDIAISGVMYPDGHGFSVSTYNDGSMVLTPGKVYAFHYTASADL